MNWFAIPREFSHACKNGDIDQVQYFIDQDLSPDIYRVALSYACVFADQPACVAKLIPLCDLKNDEGVLQSVAAVGNIESLKLLIDVCDPKINNSWALQAATANGAYRCMEVLYPVSDVEAALTILRYNHKDHEVWLPLEQYHAHQMKTKLWDALDEIESIQLKTPQRL